LGAETFFSNVVVQLNSTALVMICVGVASVALFAALFISRIGEYFLPKPKETRVADFLPFEKLLEDGKTIKCHNGSLCRCFSVNGADTSFVPPEVSAWLLEARKQWIDNLANVKVNGRVVTIREFVPLDAAKRHDHPLLAQISDKWEERLDRIYRNKHYIILSVDDRFDNDRDLEHAAVSLKASLDRYGIEEMTEHGGHENGPFSLFGRLCSPVSMPAPRIGNAVGGDLNSLLTSDTIHFTKEEGIVKFSSGDTELSCAVMGIRSLGDSIDEQMVRDLLAIDVELTLMHNFKPIPKEFAVALLMQQRKMSLTTSPSGGAYMQYSQALSMIDSADMNYQSLSEYALTMFVFGSSSEELKFGQSEIERVCRLYGSVPVREGWAAQASYFAQFPTYEIYPRTYRLMSRAIACSVCFERVAEGPGKSDWGEGPISVFKTSSGTSYRWQFHVTAEESAVAHQVILGPTGQGKTTLLAFLAGQAMRHQDLRVYFFDRFKGVKIFCDAIGGSYVNFDGEEGATSMNPFACADTGENRAFLRRWLKAITMVDDALSEREIGRAVTTAFDYLQPNERTLSNLHKACFSPLGNMRKELLRWVDGDQYGRIFNSQDDNLDLSSRFMAFDFTHIFEDDTLAPAVISYIMHRIQSVTGATGAPSLIMIDETAPMLKHPMFRDYFIIGLQEGRKKRQAYLCAFQQPNIVDNLGLGEVVRGQCQTVIFFRNPQGTIDEYETWQLTPSELGFIKGEYMRELQYAILVSRPITGESVILDVNLSGLGPYIKLYSSGRRHVLLAEQLRREIGADNYIEKFLQVA
jgi:type IV secretion system protein VirB4